MTPNNPLVPWYVSGIPIFVLALFNLAICGGEETNVGSDETSKGNSMVSEESGMGRKRDEFLRILRAPSNDGFSRILRGEYSRILKRSVDQDDYFKQDGQAAEDLSRVVRAPQGAMSRIMRAPHPGSMSRILRGGGPSSFSRILRSGGPSSFSRILRSGTGFSRILRDSPGSSFSRILKRPDSFSRILRGSSEDPEEELARFERSADNDDDEEGEQNDNYDDYYEDMKRNRGFSRILRSGFSRILRSDPSFSRILRSGSSFSRIL